MFNMTFLPYYFSIFVLDFILICVPLYFDTVNKVYYDIIYYYDTLTG